MLRTRPPFGDGSEEVNIREALLNLETHVAQYCTRHNIASPQPEQIDVSLVITLHVHVYISTACISSDIMHFK